MSTLVDRPQQVNRWVCQSWPAGDSRWTDRCVSCAHRRQQVDRWMCLAWRAHCSGWTGDWLASAGACDAFIPSAEHMRSTSCIFTRAAQSELSGRLRVQ